MFVLLLLAVVMLAAPATSPAQVSIGVTVTFAPPALPIYAQPLCPGPGFIWIPGYWAWDPDIGYYWVPGMWVLAPFVGALWTPGYWGWSDGAFIWYDGYWGPVVGFYGGINYGFGYGGFGYDGGYWSRGTFYYNRTVNNINVTNITTVYTKTVRNVRPAGASFNGGSGGTTARPTSEQLAAARQKRASLTDSQKQQIRVARADPKQRATVNRGRPAIAATAKPGVFKGPGVTKASRAGAAYKAPPSRKAAPGERVRTPKQGAEKRPSVTAPERIAPRKEPERRVTEPRPAPRRPEATPPSPKERTRGGTEMRPPATAPERIAPRKEPERRVTEPRPAPRRPETTQPLRPKEEPRGGKEERR
ncbi:MAG: hypothetical protein M1497_09975 [Nitrospirae bacterium]|nr:hypothetical protein [Nitrospirota bacterium]